MGYFLFVLALVSIYVITSFPKIYYPNLTYKFELDSSLHNILLENPHLFVILLLILVVISILFLIFIFLKYRSNLKEKRVYILWTIIIIITLVISFYFTKDIDFSANLLGGNNV